MQVRQKGAYKSSVDPMELHDKEGDRSSLEPLSPSYKSSLDLNLVNSRSNASAS